MNDDTRSDTNTPEPTFDRRTLLLGAGALAASAGLMPGLATAAEHAHEHHQHTLDPGRKGLISHAQKCIASGQICIQHCIELFKAGDTTTAECADSV